MTHRIGKTLILSLLAAVPVGADSAGTPEPIGEDFQVNTYTTLNQYAAAVAADAAGAFTVVWSSAGSSGTDSSSSSVQGQRFDAGATPVGGEFQVNTYTASYQFYPALAVNADGDFVVAWTSYGSSGTDSDSSSIQARRFDSAGAPAGDDFEVNTYTTSRQNKPAVAADADGAFVVVWQSDGGDLDTSQTSIQGQRFDAAGAPVGGQFQVNTYVTGYQGTPAVAAEAGGDFVVVWTSAITASPYSIQGQRFDAAGAPVGGEFQVNSITTYQQGLPAVATGAGGGFVVAWQSFGSDGSDSSSWSIQARRFDSAATPIADQFQVNVLTPSHQRRPAVLAEAAGGFVVVWQSFGSTSYSIQGHRFSSLGRPVGDEFQINSRVATIQGSPSVAAGVDGDFVTVWESNGSSGSDTSNRSVQGRRFRTPFFADGFESGDLSGW